LAENNRIKQAGDSISGKLVIVSVSPQSRASLAAKYKLNSQSAAGKITTFFKQLGVNYVFDTTFSRELSLLESCREFVHRYESRAVPGSLPMLASACPGWVCYAEKTHGSHILPYISTTKSPQQIMGSLVKEYFGAQHGYSPDKVYHVTVMPCYDKKLEASRPDFYDSQHETRHVDCVISTGEMDLMLMKEQVALADLDCHALDSIVGGCVSVGNHAGGGSGGYLEHIAKYASKQLFNIDIESLTYKTLRNADMREVSIEYNGETVLRFAQAYGFRNIQNIVQKNKRGKLAYDFVEVMACPSGCLNGGGQLHPTDGEDSKQWLAKVEEIYSSVACKDLQYDVLDRLYTDWLEGKDSDKARHSLHTQYHAVEKMSTALNIKW